MSDLQASASRPAFGLAGYRAAVANAYAPMRMESDTEEPFLWSVREQSFGALAISQIYSSGPIRAQIQRSTSDCSRRRIILMLMEEGSLRLEQASPQHHIRYAVGGPQTLFMMNVGRSLEVVHPGPVKILSSVFPTEFLCAHFRTIESYCGIAVPAGEGMGSILRDLLRSIWREHGQLRCAERRVLPGTLASLLGSVFVQQEDAAKERKIIDSYAERIQSVIDAELQNSELGPGLIAERLHVSSSYLFAIVRKAGTTIGQLIMDSRLDRCHEILADPGQMNHSISEVAFSWGFQDLSHFSRRFSARFGTSPRAFRQSILHGQI